MPSSSPVTKSPLTGLRASTAKSFVKNADVAAVGLEMGGSVAVGYFIGTWFDSALGTGPWGLAFFLVAGFGAAGKAVYRIVQRWKREIAASNRAEAELYGGPT